MFLTTTPEGKIYKELATDHFADPTGLGKYALFLRPSQGDIVPAELDCDIDPRRFHLGDKPQFFRHSGPRLWIHPQHQHESTDKDQQETCRRPERLRER